MKEGGGGGEGRNPFFPTPRLSKKSFVLLLLGPFFARSLTLVPHSLLLRRLGFHKQHIFPDSGSHKENISRIHTWGDLNNVDPRKAESNFVCFGKCVLLTQKCFLFHTENA